MFYYVSVADFYAFSAQIAEIIVYYNSSAVVGNRLLFAYLYALTAAVTARIAILFGLGKTLVTARNVVGERRALRSYQSLGTYFNTLLAEGAFE